MATTTTDKPHQPTGLQKLTWHAMNAAPGIGIAVAVMSKSLIGVTIGLVIAVASGFLAHKWKKKGLQHAGKERLRVGPATPIPPKAGSVFYVIGLFFFALLTIATLFIDDFRQLTRIGMAVVMFGLTMCFAALINPTLRKPAMVVVGWSMLAGGVLFLLDAKTISGEGGDAVLAAVKTGLLRGAVLFGGIATTWGMLRGQKVDATPLYDNGWYGRWGFMPWSALKVSLNESNGAHLLEATAYNGWSFQMPVADDRLDAARQLLREIESHG